MCRAGSERRAISGRSLGSGEGGAAGPARAGTRRSGTENSWFPSISAHFHPLCIWGRRSDGGSGLDFGGNFGLVGGIWAGVRKRMGSAIRAPGCLSSGLRFASAGGLGCVGLFGSIRFMLGRCNPGRQGATVRGWERRHIPALGSRFVSSTGPEDEGGRKGESRIERPWGIGGAT